MMFIIMEKDLISLDLIPIGKNSLILSVIGDRSFRLRLLELGFSPGLEILLIGQAPMGDPLYFKIRGAYFSLRKSEAKLILVKLID